MFDVRSNLTSCGLNLRAHKIVFVCVSVCVCVCVCVLNHATGHEGLNKTTFHTKWGPQLVAFYICRICQMFGINSLLKTTLINSMNSGKCNQFGKYGPGLEDNANILLRQIKLTT